VHTNELINPVEQSHFWEFNTSSANQEIPCLCESWRFVTVFTRAHY